MFIDIHSKRGDMSNALRGLSLALIILGVAGCDSILEVDNPGSIIADDLDNPQLLGALVNLPEAAGAENQDSYIFTLGMICNDVTEPLANSWAIRADEGEFHLQPNEQLEEMYDDLAVDTWVVREARRRMLALISEPESHWAIGRSYFWDGHLQVNRADMFEEITYDGGEPVDAVTTYNEAIALLQQAVQIESAAGADEIEYVAASYGTMARAERALFFETGDASHLTRAGEFALQALETKPDFRLDARYVAPATNGVYGSLRPSSLPTFGIGQIFGDGWIDPVTGDEDPRVMDFVTEPLGELSRGTSYKQTKYPDPDSPIPVSRWQEAALILAEALLHADDLPGAVDRINQVRIAANRAEFDSDDPARIREQIIYERQTEFFLEARCWQDNRYYGIFPVRWNDVARGLGLDRKVPMSQREKTGQKLEL